MQIHNAVITGSFSYNGADLSNVTSSNAYSASLSTRVTQIERVYATTGSNSFRADQSVTGSLTVTGQIVAQSLNVQQVTSSIVFSSGSNTFGCDLNSRQTFTGSVIMTGSLTVNTTGTELQVNNNGVILGNLLTDNHSITGSLRVTGSLTATGATFNGNVGICTSPSFPLDLLTSSSGTFNTIAQIFNNDFTCNNRSYLRVRQQVNAGGSVSSYFGAGQDSNLYIIANNSARGGDLIINGATGAATFVSSVDATVFNSTSNAFRFSGSNALSLVSLNSQNVVKINAAGYWGVQLVGAGDAGILVDNTGRIGIGTNTPLLRLDIQNGSLGIYHNTSVGGGNGGAQIYLGDMNFAGGAYACSAPGIGAVCSPSAAGVAGDLAFYNYTGIVACRTERMRIAGGNVGIGNTAPLHNLDIGSVRTNSGGFAFCNMVTAQGVFSTFACVGSDANVVTTITYTNTNDHNRSGVFIARWAYNSGCTALFIVSCLWNDSQNIATLAFRNHQSGALQICVSGGGGDYRVQALTQGTKAT